MRRRPTLVDRATVSRRSHLRLGVVVALTFVFFGLVVVRLIDVQQNQRAYWSEHGASSRRAHEVLLVDRGGIYDRNGAALALSIDRPTVIADPTLVEDPDALAADLAGVLGVPETELREKLGGEGQYRVLLRNADPEIVEGLRTESGREAPVGIFLQPANEREYPSGELARSIVGRVYPDQGVDEDGSHGRSGVESLLDDDLQGEPGYVVYEQDRGGHPIAGAPTFVLQPKPGADVHLTIDQRVQYVTEKLLTEKLEELDAAEASAIVMRPSSGEVLALSTVAHAADGSVQPTSDNRISGAIYEPGSVNKMITIAAAIEEGEVSPDTLRRVPDSLQIADKTFTDHDPHPVESWTTADILARSSNIGTIQIASALGQQRLDGYLRSFGFGETTGSDMPGEVAGLLEPVDRWSGTSLGSIAIGQGIAVTPLQLVSAYNVIANDGLYVPAHTISATDDGAGRRSLERSTPRRVVSRETAGEVREMLHRVVDDGTGRAAAVPGYRTWGKTGTARLPQENPTDADDGYLNEDGEYDYASTFVGGVDGADLTILVVVNRPATYQTGGAAAAPVFAELASLTLRTLDIAPTPGPIRDRQLPVTDDVAADLGGDPRSVDTDQQG